MPPTLRAFWKFTRPHTIYGTAASLVGIFLIASASLGAITAEGLAALLVAQVSCLCANVYIVGLNQLTDIKIDRINKPYLPIASGEISPRTGTALVGILGVAALVIALQNLYLFATVAASVLIGTAYSLPPLRLKRFALFASLCIFTVRGLIVNLGLWGYFLDGAGQPVQFGPAILCLSLFVTLFTFVIAIFKDIPDMEGDRRFAITTFSLRLGKRFVFDLSCWLLAATYLLVSALSTLFLSPAGITFLLVFHTAMLAVFFYRRGQVDLKDNAEITDFYQFIWKLYYVEYLVYPLTWWL
ncbi:homogentisate phytyltransferase [Gloeobacter violaceus]|uniref:Gll0283 protein n=1 Tax=Gloeobacter violaceus (strain ATCC 29082 / PCC 7421) TaxID=251221 RepID=Q7NNX5_GLOVI|nr:homogentisate phytyltransferase [Gloeobacter violaceus]BAC88224.1 gll0283 [Gloeobacter violaceus PCC 7421]